MSKERIGIVVAMVVFIGAIVVMLCDAHRESNPWDKWLKPQVSLEYPAPAVTYPPTIEDCVIEVNTLYEKQRRCGNGVVIEMGDDTFVLSSSMIFVDDYKEISLEFNPNWEVRGQLARQNDVWGLAAVACQPGFNRGYAVSDAPNLPPYTESMAVSADQSTPVKVLEYVTTDWFLITGVDETYIGAPLLNGEDITGIIVGMDSSNPDQAIVVGNRAIRAFCEQVVRPEVDLPPNVFRSPANPNMLFGNEQ